MSIFNKSYNSVQASSTTNQEDNLGVISVTVDNSDIFIFPVIFSQFDLQKKEKIQIIESFNESVHLYAFGKNADVLSLSGHFLNDNINGSSIGFDSTVIDKYDNNIRSFEASKKGILVEVSGPNNIVFTGVAVSMNINKSSEIEGIISFNMTLVSVDSTLGVTSKTSKGIGNARTR